ncbi:MAG TPA: type IV toxin-antitoxin system AbiEi family antitoxin domain-containing protein [Acidimicrobiales bacterium]|jgi:very-short-patch-repair endonuclease|nr:type IV toxin-antitoxin system AbiEi family antitoxin domain-containing protein [Acidimicrobiales bacterium]
MSIWETMASQHGVATLQQFKAAGVPERTVQHWAATGKLIRAHENVYVAPASPDTFLRTCWIACKAAPGCALSYRTAAYLWDLIDEEPPVEILVKRGRTPAIDGVIVHQTRDAYEWHARRGLRVTSPLRAVLDLGAVDPRSVEGAVERGRVANLFTIAALEWQLAEVGRRGRAGTASLRKVLDEWALGAARPDGLLEPRFARLRVRYELPEAQFQHAVGPYRVDFAYPELLIAIEVDGYAVHASPTSLRRDLERQNYLVGLGWTVLRFTWHDVVRRPGYVSATIRAELERAERNMWRPTGSGT